MDLIQHRPVRISGKKAPRVFIGKFHFVRLFQFYKLSIRFTICNYIILTIAYLLGHRGRVLFIIHTDHVLCNNSDTAFVEYKTMPYRLLADLLVIGHVAFILFAVFGAALTFSRPKIIWLHVPAVIWAALIEFAGWVCPLTPLENRLRMMGGEAGYSGGFVEHYILPVLYPGMLTRKIQVLLGILVLAFNLFIYIRFMGSQAKK